MCRNTNAALAQHKKVYLHLCHAQQAHLGSLFMVQSHGPRATVPVAACRHLLHSSHMIHSMPPLPRLPLCSAGGPKTWLSPGMPAPSPASSHCPPSSGCCGAGGNSGASAAGCVGGSVSGSGTPMAVGEASRGAGCLLGGSAVQLFTDGRPACRLHKSFVKVRQAHAVLSIVCGACSTCCSGIANRRLLHEGCTCHLFALEPSF